MESEMGKQPFHCKGKSLTCQDYRDECTIPKVIEKYNITGRVTNVRTDEPMYGEFHDVPNYQESLQIIIDADNKFNALSSKIRDRFQNDPAKMIEFMQDPENAEECEKLGLMKIKRTKKEEKTEPVEPVSTLSP